MPETEVPRLPYRKVTYTEQCWYILRFWFRRLLRKKGRHAKETDASVRVPRMPKTNR